jgi:heme exporter protein C
MASAPASSLSASLTGLANPTRFMDLSGRILPWLVGLTAILLVLGVWLAFFVAPADYQQGDTARIMFIHVPSAWLSLFLYTMMTVSALGTLVWRHPLADVAQKAAAPLGAAFAFLCLVTGSLWGKPMWGTYWVWDARLTSMLVLFLMYCGILALWRTIEEPGRAARAVAILTLVGVINIPIVKFSVDWWSTLHQPAGVLKLTGSTVDPSIRWPLLEMAIAFTLLALTLHLVGMRTEILRRRVRTLTILAAERAEREAA